MENTGNSKNVITIILASLLSLILVLMCVITPVYASLSSLVKPEKIVEMVNKIGHELILFEGGEGSDLKGEDSQVVNEYMEKLQNVISGEMLVKTVLSEFELEDFSVEDLLQSKSAQEILTVYAGDVSEMLLSGTVKQSVTEEKVKEILHRNRNEIVLIAKQSKNNTLTDEEIENKIYGAIEQYSADISDSLPSLEKMTGVVDEGVVKAIRFVISDTITWILVIICVVFAGLVYLCRMKNFVGFLWLGIDSGIAALLLGVFIAVLSQADRFVNDALTKLLANSVLSVYMGNLVIGVVLLAVLAAVIISLYFVLKHAVLKKKEATQI